MSAILFSNLLLNFEILRDFCGTADCVSEARAPGRRRSFQVSVAPRPAHPEGVAAKLVIPQPAPSRQPRQPATPSRYPAVLRPRAAHRLATPRHARPLRLLRP